MYVIMCTRLFVFFLVIASLLSCKKEGTISLLNLNDNIGAEITDSATVYAATYQLDPLPTSGTGVMLVGNMNDVFTGNLTVSAYFRIGNSSLSATTLPEDAVLDSISLALPYEGYYYGDTTQTQGLALHKLTEAMELINESNAWEEDEKPVFASGSALFSNSSFTYETQILGTASFRPKPNKTTDTVFIKIDPSFASTLWDKIKNNNSQITNEEEFLEYIKGFALVPTTQTSVITAFPTDSIAINVYYSYIRTTDGKQIQESINMKIDDNAYQFNHIQVDRSQSSLKNLRFGVKGELSGAETGQQVALQGLSGLVTKIQFPYLHAFVNQTDVVINKAELSIETPTTSYVLFSPPVALNIMLADQYGIPKSLLTGSYDNSYTQSAYLTNDISGGTSSGKYTFNLTEYVSAYKGADEDEKSALYLTIPVSDLLTRTNRLLIGAGNGEPPIKLRIIYTKYK